QKARVYRKAIGLLGTCCGLVISIGALGYDAIFTNEISILSGDQVAVCLLGIFLAAISLCLASRHSLRWIHRLVLLAALGIFAFETGLYQIRRSQGFKTDIRGIGNTAGTGSLMGEDTVRFLRNNYKDDDAIIVCNIGVAYYIEPLRVDFHLKQREIGGKYVPFGQHIRDPYLGVPLIDTAQYLKEVLEKHKRTWIIASPGIDKLSDDIRGLIMSYPTTFTDSVNDRVRLLLIGREHSRKTENLNILEPQ
ncbi:MAG: hypothetical protein O7D34_02325, partial [Ignavibacteria bacterium]|nr:hypothetical protein [Ignavibacteria bacterium]